jgi:hypothetical protein
MSWIGQSSVVPSSKHSIRLQLLIDQRHRHFCDAHPWRVFSIPQQALSPAPII